MVCGHEVLVIILRPTLRIFYIKVARNCQAKKDQCFLRVGRESCLPDSE